MTRPHTDKAVHAWRLLADEARRQGPTLDFEAVLDRAEDLGFERGAPLGTREAPSEAESELPNLAPELGALVADYRQARGDASVLASGTEPNHVAGGESPRWTGRARSASITLIAAAACALLWVGADRIGAATGSGGAHQATMTAEPAERTHSAPAATPGRGTHRATVAPPASPEAAPNTESQPAVGATPQGTERAKATPPAPDARDAATSSRGSAEPHRVPRDELGDLDRRARAAWRAGDLREAAKLFHKVTRKGGRTELAEMAFGDLFTLRRKLGGPNAEAKAWRDYLRRFPHGTFADDARAGLCRRATRPGTCWQRYLDDFPRGTHRREAQTSVDGGAEGRQP